MTSGRDIEVILSNTKELFLVMSIIMLVMAGVCFLLGEPQNSIAFIDAFIVSLGIGVLLWMVFPDIPEPELRHAIIIAALAYPIVAAITMIPYYVIQGIPPLDAFFEGMSGWTGTGMTMIADPQNSDRVIQLWRSTTEWLGGFGVIVLMITILIRPGTSTYVLYQSESHKEKIHPSVRSTVRTMWGLYVILTILGIFLLYIAGMPLWDSLNHSLASFATGGFSIYPESIAAYDSIWIEMAISLLVIIGALPFVVIYRTIRDGKMALFKDIQARAMFIIIIFGAMILTAENYFTYGNIIDSARYSLFQFISAVTTTGFQTADIASWTPTAMLIMSVAMIIGGCAGSTASGIKVARAIFLTNQFKLWSKKTLMSKSAIVTIKLGNKRVTEDALNQELSEATLISFLWVVSVLASVMIMSHILGPQYDIAKIIFEVCSVHGNVGLSCGIVGPGLHYLGKILFIFDMWIGRLEIIPVLLLIRYLIKGFNL
ncbi:potassium transporter [Methanocella sp. CWC-04]|uniref:Potassium transporter n=1 Tax=Methanooceanicella nereidis TaxID=2052831 RepID=A0AAP2W664_9EURY|nr:TrkH family potassium uptake protein [Methanocella sp. CWC-04]MCD1293939.1 potassium transporter [Methanocella sp. CWC-04]